MARRQAQYRRSWELDLFLLQETGETSGRQKAVRAEVTELEHQRRLQLK